jgi:hypothetical protein
MGDWEDILTGGVGALGTYLLSQQAPRAIRESGAAYQTGAQALGQQLATQAAGTFKPFTVSTGLGPGISVGQEGGVSVTMPESQLADLKALARSGAQQLVGAIGPGKLQEEQARIQGMLLGPGIGAAQQDVYNQLQALRAPEQQRQRLALEERLFSQGREGLRTAMYGGAPEQLAFEKAIQEQQAADALMARQQALAEQQQTAGLISEALGLGGQQQALQAELGLGGVQAAFLPQQQALNLLTAATPFSELGTRAGLQGVVTQGELGLGGLQAATAAEQYASLIEQAQLNALAQQLFPPETGLFGQIIGGLFGAGSTGQAPDFLTVLNSYLGEGFSTSEAVNKAREFFKI